MRFDKQASLIDIAQVSDGMGGYTDGGETAVATFAVAVSKLAQELALTDYGFDTDTDLRVFTRQVGLETGDLLRIEDKLYRVNRIRSYDRITSMVVRAE